MRWIDPDIITTVIIPGFSALISALALGVAICAYRANYRLAEKIANQAGRLHSVNIRVGYDLDEEYGYTELVAINGPSDVTITNIALEVTYHTGVGLFPYQITVYLDGFKMLQKDLRLTGPSPPKRIKPYDLAVWKFPRWDGLFCRGHGLIYRVKIETAHIDKPSYSEDRAFGPHMRTISGTIRNKPRIASDGGLEACRLSCISQAYQTRCVTGHA